MMTTTEVRAPAGAREHPGVRERLVQVVHEHGVVVALGPPGRCRGARSSDPHVHTHVAVSNKVQDETGRWLAVDGVSSKGRQLPCPDGR